MTAASPILRMRNVRKRFGTLDVLRGIDLDIHPGQTTVIIGPSGCGKSVLLKHLIGLLRPDAGEVFFRDHEISKLPEPRLVPIRRRMGFLFQGGALFDSMSVEENLLFPLIEHNVGKPDDRLLRVREVLALVGLDGLQDRFPAELSGGQQKRIALARAIVLHPEVIFYDEPTTGLDPIRADLINELILRLQQHLHNTAVVVTHDMASARKVGDRVLMLHEGQFLLDTTPEKLHDVTDEVVRRFITGQASPDDLATLHAGELADRSHTP